MSDFGATAAFRGYRLQTLYILHKILRNKGNMVFHPEGSEDLLIKLDNNTISEDIQIKARASVNLSLSHFSINKEEGFFKRICKYKNMSKIPSIRIVNFYEFGAEFEDALSNNENKAKNRIKEKLKKSNISYSEDEIIFIFENVSLIKVNEQKIYEEVIKDINQMGIACSSEDVFDNLMIWLYTCSEKLININYTDLKNKILGIGTTINAQMQYKSHWGTSLKILSKNRFDSDIDSNIYYNGVYTKYTHIVNNCDIVRERWISKMRQSLTDKNILIVHGASGEGKTSLCYRAMNSFFTHSFRFELMDCSIENYKDVYEITQCIEGISKNLNQINQPIGLYIDVSPRQVRWTDLLREIATIKNLYVLISIRQEDYSRANYNIEGFEYADLFLKFNKEEAKEFYGLFQEQNGINISFETSWENFRHGSLMEYIYMLRNGGNTLEGKIKNQIKRLEKDDEYSTIELLRYVSYAASNYSSIDIDKLKKTYTIGLQKMLDFLNNEYLLCIDKEHKRVRGLHFIRSKIITKIFLARITVNEFETIKKCLELISKESIKIYLISVFYKGNYNQKLKDYIKTNNSWVNWFEISQVVEAFIWDDINQFISYNKSIIKKTIGDFGAGWPYILGFDLLRQEGVADIIKELESVQAKLHNTSLDNIRNIRNTYTNKILGQEKIFYSAQTVLEKLLHKKTLLESILDWKGFSYICACKTYNVLDFSTDKYTKYSTCIPEINEIKNIEELGELIVGLFPVYKNEIVNYIEKNKKDMLAEFRKLHKIVKVEETDNNIKIYRLFPMPLDNDYENQTDRNYMVVTALELLNKLIPNKNVYLSEGLGHKTFDNELGINFDDSIKNIKGDYFKDTRLTVINRIYNNLGDNIFRKETWNEFIIEMIERLEDVNLYLNNMNSELKRFFKYDKFKSIYPYISSMHKEYPIVYNNTIFSPICSINKFGDEIESINFDESKAFEKKNKKEDIEYLLRQLYTSLDNANRQMIKCIEYYSYQQKCTIQQKKQIEKVVNVNELKGNIRLFFCNLNDVKEYVNKSQKYIKEKFICFNKNLILQLITNLEEVKSNCDSMYLILLAMHKKYNFKYFEIEKKTIIENSTLQQKVIEDIVKSIKSEFHEIDLTIKFNDNIVINIDTKAALTVSDVFERVPTILISILSDFYEKNPYDYFIFENKYKSVYLYFTYKGYATSFKGMILNNLSLAVSKKYNPALAFSQLVLHEENKDDRLDMEFLQEYGKGFLLFKYLMELEGFEFDDIGTKICNDYLNDNDYQNLCKSILNKFHQKINEIITFIDNEKICKSPYVSELIEELNIVYDNIFSEDIFQIDKSYFQSYIDLNENVTSIAFILSIIIIDELTSTTI